MKRFFTFAVFSALILSMHLHADSSFKEIVQQRMSHVLNHYSKDLCPGTINSYQKVSQIWNKQEMWTVAEQIMNSIKQLDIFQEAIKSNGDPVLWNEVNLQIFQVLAHIIDQQKASQDIIEASFILVSIALDSYRYNHT